VAEKPALHFVAAPAVEAQAALLALRDTLNTTPDTSGYALGSLWQSTFAPAADEHGNIFVATGNGDLRDLLSGDHVALLTRIALHADLVGFNGDGFLRAAELHLEIDTCTIADLKNETFLFGDFESGRFGFGFVVTNFELGENVLAGIVGEGGMNEAGFEVKKSDCYVGHSSTGRIGNSADQSGVLCHHGR